MNEELEKPDDISGGLRSPAAMGFTTFDWCPYCAGNASLFRLGTCPVTVSGPRPGKIYAEKFNCSRHPDFFLEVYEGKRYYYDLNGQCI